MEQTRYEKTLARAFRLLAAKARSEVELRERLLEKVWADEEVVERVLARLKELGYLNDEQFAASFAASRLTAKPVGRNRLRRDLQRKKIPSQVADKALEDAYSEGREEELIETAIKKRLRLKGRPTTREETKKLYDYLLRLGFGYDLVIRKVREVTKLAEEDEDFDA
ncbi:MAG TPA: regulatory protein RecX [Blastocatellia bacterium]|nr:regulatory protein RecX [Blastocatellia bacterium]